MITTIKIKKETLEKVNSLFKHLVVPSAPDFDMNSIVEDSSWDTKINVIVSALDKYFFGPKGKGNVDEEKEEALQSLVTLEFDKLSGENNSAVLREKLMDSLMTHLEFKNREQAEACFAKLEEKGVYYMTRPGYYKRSPDYV